MNRRRAYQLAIHALENEIQAVAFDANVYDQGLVKSPHGERQSKLRAELVEAVQILKAEIKQPQPAGDQLAFEL